MNIYLTEAERKKLEETIARSDYFDKEETFTGCTVQVLTNTKTGEVSVGWIKPDGTITKIV